MITFRFRNAFFAFAIMRLFGLSQKNNTEKKELEMRHHTLKRNLGALCARWNKMENGNSEHMLFVT